MRLLICTLSGQQRELRQKLDKDTQEIIHLPIEQYSSLSGSPDIKEVKKQLNNYINVILGEEESTRYFLHIFEPSKIIDDLEETVFFARTPGIAELLEKAGIPAIRPLSGNKSIDMVETILRFRRFGPSLYPCKKNVSNDIPGFLEELGIPVTELPVFEKRGLTDKKIESYRKKITICPPDAVLFHSLRAVNTIPVLFDKLDLMQTCNIALTPKIADKMEQQGIPPSQVIDKEEDKYLCNCQDEG